MGVVRLIVGEQVSVSRNLGESLPKKVKRAMWAVVYAMKCVQIGIAATRHEQLGSRIEFEGRPGFVSNWAQGDCPSIKLDDGECIQYADRARIANVVSIGEIWHRFSAMAWWYASSWHGIAVNKRLYPEAFASIVQH